MERGVTLLFMFNMVATSFFAGARELDWEVRRRLEAERGSVFSSPDSSRATDLAELGEVKMNL
jgi:hypothetical protein